MSDIISIETTNPGLYLELEIGNVCNYNCSYCPPQLHTGKEWLNFPKLIKYINKVKPKTVLLAGGEPTFYPWLDQLLFDLKVNNVRIDVTTNGSRPIEWWQEHIDLIDILTFSYHIEYSNIDSFINKLEYLTEHKVVTVNVSMIVDRFDECLEHAMRISKVKNVYTSLKALNNIQTERLYDYTDEQLEIMSTLIKPRVKTKENDFNIEFFSKDSMGHLTKLRAQTIISNKDNSYKGWNCWKGLQCMKIISNGDIYKATCELGFEPFGNIYDRDIKIPIKPEKCTKDYCYCLTDLKSIKKERV